MQLSDMKKGMIVYVRGFDPPTYKKLYECTITGWTERIADLTLECNGKHITRTFGELLRELPNNVTQTSTPGIYQEEEPQSTGSKEPTTEKGSRRTTKE